HRARGVDAQRAAIEGAERLAERGDAVGEEHRGTVDGALRRARDQARLRLAAVVVAVAPREERRERAEREHAEEAAGPGRHLGTLRRCGRCAGGPDGCGREAARCDSLAMMNARSCLAALFAGAVLSASLPALAQAPPAPHPAELPPLPAAPP